MITDDEIKEAIDYASEIIDLISAAELKFLMSHRTENCGAQAYLTREIVAAMLGRMLSNTRAMVSSPEYVESTAAAAAIVAERAIIVRGGEYTDFDTFVKGRK